MHLHQHQDVLRHHHGNRGRLETAWYVSNLYARNDNNKVLTIIHHKIILITTTLNNRCILIFINHFVHITLILQLICMCKYVNIMLWEKQEAYKSSTSSWSNRETPPARASFSPSRLNLFFFARAARSAIRNCKYNMCTHPWSVRQLSIKSNLNNSAYGPDETNFHIW